MTKSVRIKAQDGSVFLELPPSPNDKGDGEDDISSSRRSNVSNGWAEGEQEEEELEHPQVLLPHSSYQPAVSSLLRRQSQGSPQHMRKVSFSQAFIPKPSELNTTTAEGLSPRSRIKSDNVQTEALGAEVTIVKILPPDRDPTNCSENNLSESGVQVPNLVAHLLRNTHHTTLKTDFVNPYSNRLRYFLGVPFIREVTKNWIRVGGVLMWLSSLIEGVKALTVIEVVSVVVSNFFPAVFSLTQVLAYMSWRRANYWLLALYTLSQAVFGVFDLVLLVASISKTFTSSRTTDPLFLSATLYESLVTALSFIMLVVTSVVIARVCVLVRQDIAGLKIRLPFEQFESQLNANPFLQWYFSLPPPRLLSQHPTDDLDLPPDPTTK